MGYEHAKEVDIFDLKNHTMKSSILYDNYTIKILKNKRKNGGPVVLAHICNLMSPRLKSEDLMFKASLGYRISSRPAWAFW